MLQKRLLPYLRHLPLLAGVEVYTDGQSLLLQAVVLQYDGRNITVQQRESEITDVKTLLSKLPKSVPLVLNINGKGVIHRYLAAKQEQPTTDLLRQILPNAKKTDFHVQQQQSPDGSAMVSVIRKDQYEKLTEPFRQNSNQLVAVSLGPFAATAFLSSISSQEQGEINFGGHHFFFNANGVTQYKYEAASSPLTKKITLIGEEMNERYVVSFASALLVLSESPMSMIHVDEVAKTHQELQGKQQFKRSGLAILSLFLIMLILNTFFFLHYGNQLSAIPEKQDTQLKKEIEQLRKELAGQEEILSALNVDQQLTNTTLAMIADTIGASLPHGILLDELSIYPRNEAESRKQRKPIYDRSLIEIKGETKALPALHSWIKLLTQMEFSTSVMLQQYQYDDKAAAGIFTLHIKLR